MKKLELNQMENLEGGKFWGWGETRWSDCVDGYQLGTTTYYMLWMNVDSDVSSRAC